MKNIFLLSTLVLGLMLLSSCQHTNKVDSMTNAAADSTTAKTTKKGITETQDSSTVILPSPMQIGSIFKKAGLTYMPGLTNTVKDISLYNSTYSQAVNMGVYGADLSYCVLNKQSQNALDYIKALHSLADKLGFGSIFETNSMSKRFQDNLGSEDSLTNIITELQMEADTYLASNNQKYISSLTFAGAWIESMYIGSKVLANKKDEKISSRISEQMDILHNIIKALGTYKGQDSPVDEMLTSFTNIENTYLAYDEVKKIGKDSDEMAKLTDAHIAEISKMIQDLREKFILSPSNTVS